MPSIVQVIVTQQVAPLPETLQATGAFVSQGDTILAPGTSSVLTQLSDLANIITPPASNASLTWSGGVVSVTTSSPHGYPTGITVYLTIAGATPDGYNGTFLATTTGSSAFSYPLTNNPGSATTIGTFQPAQIQQMANTFFAQGVSQSVYVLE